MDVKKWSKKNFIILKKGQITIFVIIGIILLVAILFIITISPKKEKIPEIDLALSINQIKSFTDSCIKITLEKGIFDVGFIEVGELESYINNNLKNCTGNYNIFNGLNITEGPISSEVKITDDDESLDLKINYLLNIQKENKTAEISEFFSKYGLEFESSIHSINGITSTPLVVDSKNNLARLNIPEGIISLNSDGSYLKSVNILIKDKKSFPSSPGRIIGNLVYDLRPDGAKFNKSITLEIKYDDENNDSYVDGTTIKKRNIEIAYFNRSKNEWVSIPTEVDKTMNIARAEITHFSEYAAREYPIYSARVYKIDPLTTPQPEIVQLSNLDGSGYLSGSYVKVNSNVVYSDDNIFVYDINTESEAFDHTMGYYTADNAATYFRNLGFNMDHSVSIIPNAPPSSQYPPNSCEANAAFADGQDEGCSNIYIPAQTSGCPNNMYKDTTAILHEYTHLVYCIMTSGFSITETEAYATYFPSSYNDGTYGCSMNPVQQDPLCLNHLDSTKDIYVYGREDSYEGQPTGESNNFVSLASALWGVRKEFGQSVADKLIYSSISTRIYGEQRAEPGDDTLQSLVDSDWQLYHGQQHVNKTVEIFNARGIGINSTMTEVYAEDLG